MLVVNDMLRLDALALELIQGIRWEPLTAFFVVASAWWVKGPLFVAAGALRDASLRRLIPVTALATAVSLLLANLAATLIKALVERPRPAVSVDAINPAVATPADPSFPSGHTTTAFAAAVVVSVLHPRLRVPALAIAALVGVSRMYLGVHFPIDVLAGAVLGSAIGLGTGLAARAAIRSGAWKPVWPGRLRRSASERSTPRSSPRSFPATAPSRAGTYSPN
jgi:undecaprenyl-diphosphatase